jgi:hypothetical protein
MNTHSSQNGFIALISILILSAVLLTTTLGLAQFGIANRFFILNLEQKASSKKLAEACIHIARIQTYNDPLLIRNSPLEVPIGDSGAVCDIISITPNGNESVLVTRAQTGEAITNFSVVVENQNGNFISFQEIPNL